MDTTNTTKQKTYSKYCEHCGKHTDYVFTTIVTTKAGRQIWCNECVNKETFFCVYCKKKYCIDEMESFRVREKWGNFYYKYEMCKDCRDSVLNSDDAHRFQFEKM